MTWYRRIDSTNARSVTAYEKPSGRHVTVPIIEAVNPESEEEGLYAEVPHDDEDEPIDDDFLEESDTYEEVDYEPVPVDEVEQEEEESEDEEEDEEMPKFEDADLSEVSYRDLQTYAGDYEDINGSQSREDLEEELRAAREEPGEEEESEEVEIEEESEEVEEEA